MKFSISKVLLIGLIFFACKKTNLNDVFTSLKGTWKMVAVKDNHSNTSATKPDSVSENVIITFTTQNRQSGIFTGTTSSNQLGPNPYMTGEG